jgi:hypothetical protein
VDFYDAEGNQIEEPAPAVEPPTRPPQAPATAPARGSCRWIVQPIAPTRDNLRGRAGRIEINGTAYLFTTRAENVPGQNRPTVVSYQLDKQNGTAYDLPGSLDGCDCPDATFHPERPGGCKHARALRAALKAIKWELLTNDAAAHTATS